MNPHDNQLFQQKCCSPQDAVKRVKNGDTVFLGTASSIANALCDALARRAGELKDVTLTSGMGHIFSPGLQNLDPDHFRGISTFFMGGWERANKKNVPVDFTSVHLSQVDLWCRETAPSDVAFLEVSPPDEEGCCSFGATGVSLHSYVAENAKQIVLQVNRNVPYVYGERNLIHFSKAEAIVCADTPLMTVPNMTIDQSVKRISEYLLDQIHDGDCIQLGLGSLANAVGFGLKTRNDLGIHSEMLSDSMMELIKMGVVNNSRKTFLKGKSAVTFALGSEELYHYIDHNPDFYFAPFPIVNDPVNIAKNDHMISINTALAADLMGQIVADNIAGSQYSATGGQVDFVRGAQMSKGGKSFIAFTSTYQTKDGQRKSRIVAQLPPGAAVTTPRADVQYVVTEYGCVNLKPLCMRDRVRAMIDLAHPDFRPALLDEAKQTGLL